MALLQQWNWRASIGELHAVFTLMSAIASFIVPDSRLEELAAAAIGLGQAEGLVASRAPPTRLGC